SLGRKPIDGRGGPAGPGRGRRIGRVARRSGRSERGSRGERGDESEQRTESAAHGNPLFGCRATRPDACAADRNAPRAATLSRRASDGPVGYWTRQSATVARWRGVGWLEKNTTALPAVSTRRFVTDGGFVQMRTTLSRLTRVRPRPQVRAKSCAAVAESWKKI